MAYPDFPFLNDGWLGISNYREKLKLTIFGSYCEESKIRLARLRDNLIAQGYAQARIVEDYEYPPKKELETDPQRFESKSKFWLKNSDALFFVFFVDADNVGVSSEFTSFVEDNDRMWRSVLFVEAKKPSDDLPISAMISAKVTTYEIKCTQFALAGDDQLKNKALGYLPSIMKRQLGRLSGS